MKRLKGKQIMRKHFTPQYICGTLAFLRPALRNFVLNSGYSVDFSDATCFPNLFISVAKGAVMILDILLEEAVSSSAD